VRIRNRRAHNVLHREFSRRQSVGHQRPMAAPGHCLGAHQGAGFDLGEFDRALHTGVEFGRLHVIREAAKTCIVPANIF